MTKSTERIERELREVSTAITAAAPLVAAGVDVRLDRIRGHLAELLDEVRALEAETNRIALVDLELMRELDEAGRE